jgi:putative cell wall-binding protein
MPQSNLPVGRRLAALVAVSCVLATGLSLAGTPPAARATVTPLITLVQQPGSYSRPILVTNDGSRLFVVQQTGQIYVAGGTPTLYLDLSGQVGYDGGERGLLGLAFAPDFATSKLFYVYYTKTSDGSLQISRFEEMATPALTKATEATILNILHPGHPNHNGGMLAFGPDGNLYIGTGDGGGANDPGPGCGNAQNTGVLLGKLLRISPHTTGIGYGIPPGNPTGSTVLDEVWSWGLRNPWRWSFDRSTGALWIGDVGQNAIEEVDRAFGPDPAKGANFGWQYYEGTRVNNTHNCLAPAGVSFPLSQYGHGANDSVGCAIVGGYVYRGSAYPDLTGRYFFSDDCSGTIWDVPANAAQPAYPNVVAPEALLGTSLNVSSFGEDQDGELYVADLSGGHIYKVTSNVQRVYGTDRYATSAAIAQFGGYGTGGTVYIATGTNFPDALAGAAVAGKDDDPVLLVLPTGIPAPVLTRLKALAPSKAVILGSTSAVSAAVATQLADLPSHPTVVRDGGADRYETAALIADPTPPSGTPNYPTVVGGVFIATGTNFPDALSIAAVAGSKGWPLLLVQPDAIPTSVQSVLDDFAPNDIYILGGTGVISSAVETQLAGYVAGASNVHRIAGSDRYATSAQIALTFFHNTGANSGFARPDPAYVATGTVFADALSGAPLAAQHDAPLLLVAPGSVSAAMVTEVRDELVPHRIVIFGGSSAVSYSVGAQLGGYCQP